MSGGRTLGFTFWVEVGVLLPGQDCLAWHLSPCRDYCTVKSLRETIQTVKYFNTSEHHPHTRHALEHRDLHEVLNCCPWPASQLFLANRSELIEDSQRSLGTNTVVFYRSILYLMHNLH